jgi:hypothetical protein
MESRMSETRVCAIWMSLLFGFGAWACGSGDAARVAPPTREVTASASQPAHVVPSEQMVELPRSNPGGQSGSIGTTQIGCTVVEKRRVVAADETLPGYTLDALHAALRKQFAKPLALSWYIGTRVATGVELSFDLPGEATLVKSGLVNGPVTDELSCAHADLVEERGALRVRTSDGLLDAEVATDIVFGPLDVAHGPGAALRHLISMRELNPQLVAAIDDALAAVGATESYSGIRVELMRSDSDDTAWELRLRLVPEKGEEGTLELARAWHDWPPPAERVPYTPRAELAAACERSTPPMSGVAPDSNEMPFNSIAGTWLLCGGNYPASVRVEHAGLRVTPDGGFVVLGFEAGELVEQPGLGRQGELWPAQPDRYFEFVAGSNLAPAPPMATFVPGRIVGEMLLPDSGEYGGLRGLRGQFEPAIDRRTLRLGPIDTWVDPPDLRYVRTDLPVRPAGMSQWKAGEAAGMAGCAAHDQVRRLAIAADVTRITGSFALCTGELRGGARLVLEPGGRFRALDARGALVRQGRYDVITDPRLIYSGDSVADLVLTDDAGTRDVLGLAAVSERPFKMLMSAYRPEDLAWAPDRFAVLSPEQ